MDTTRTTGGVTFKVSDTVLKSSAIHTSISEIVGRNPLISRRKGVLLYNTNSNPKIISPSLDNGFVGSFFRAYNEHYHLKISPDHVWIAITTALANYIDKHAEEMRRIFVDFDGKKKIVVYGGGTILTANYDCLLGLISDEIDKNTKGDIRSWLECEYTTSTKLSKTVSKLVLMGAMKNYFSYKMCLCCGLPQVTLEGTVDDWKKIREKVKKMSEWNVSDLTSWVEVLDHVLAHFVDAFNNKIDTDFWNRIAHSTGGGSGPRYLEGWILAFVPFTDDGRYVLNKIDEIKRTNKFGRMDTNDVPPTAIEVPVEIDDNGRLYNTIFYAGAIGSAVEGVSISPTLDWALIDMTNAIDAESAATDHQL